MKSAGVTWPIANRIAMSWNIRRESNILRASAWTALPHLMSQIIRLGGNLLLTRLLAPDYFGIVAVILTVQMILALLSDIGLRTTVIQSKSGDDPAFLNTAWTMQVLRGLLTWFAGLGLALALHTAQSSQLLPTGTAWDAPVLPIALAVATFAAVITGFQSTNHITLNRHLDLKRISLIEVIAQIGGLVWMVGWSLASPSIWALVTGGLATAFISTILTHTWLPGIRNTLAWHPAHAAELFSFGVWILFSSTLFIMAGQMDRIVLGGLVAPSTLGLYALALNLAILPDLLGGRLFSSVALPYLSETARSAPGEFRAAYLRIRLPLDLALVAAAGFIFASGKDLVALLYDDRYHDAGPMLQILSFALLFSRYGSTCLAYVALGAPRLLAYVTVTKLVALSLLLPICHEVWGLNGALFAIAFHGAFTLPQIFAYNRRYNLLSLKIEALAMLGWPTGYLAGLAVAYLL